MAYNIQYKKSVAKDLAHIGKPETQRLLDKTEKDLSKRPDRVPTLQDPLAGLRIMRINDSHVIYAVLDEEVLVLRIGHRRDHYKYTIDPALPKHLPLGQWRDPLHNMIFPRF